MPPTCTVCPREDRGRIDEMLLRGVSTRSIAKQCEAPAPSAAAVLRHKAHLAEHVAKAHDAREIASADTLTAKLRWIEAEARRLGQKAERAGDTRTALVAVRELVRMTELAARMQAARLQASGDDGARPKVSPQRLSELLARLYLADPGNFMWDLRKSAALLRMQTTKLTFGEAIAQLEEEERAVPKETRLLEDGEHHPGDPVPTMFEVAE